MLNPNTNKIVINHATLLRHCCCEVNKEKWKWNRIKKISMISINLGLSHWIFYPNQQIHVTVQHEKKIQRLRFVWCVCQQLHYGLEGRNERIMSCRNRSKCHGHWLTVATASNFKNRTRSGLHRRRVTNQSKYRSSAEQTRLFDLSLSLPVACVLLGTSACVCSQTLGATHTHANKPSEGDAWASTNNSLQ